MRRYELGKFDNRLKGTLIVPETLNEFPQHLVGQALAIYLAGGGGPRRAHANHRMVGVPREGGTREARRPWPRGKGPWGPGEAIEVSS